MSHPSENWVKTILGRRKRNEELQKKKGLDVQGKISEVWGRIRTFGKKEKARTTGHFTFLPTVSSTVWEMCLLRWGKKNEVQSSDLNPSPRFTVRKPERNSWFLPRCTPMQRTGYYRLSLAKQLGDGFCHSHPCQPAEGSSKRCQPLRNTAGEGV